MTTPTMDRYPTPNLDTGPVSYRAGAAKLINNSHHHFEALTPESPYVYAENDTICIENQGTLPTGHCVVTNELSDVTVKLPLRDPAIPGTWWGKRPSIRVGLSLQVVKRIRWGIAGTWLAVGMGIGLITFAAAGLIFGFDPLLTFTNYAVGSLLALVGGFFRAGTSITASKVGRSFTVVHGAHPGFLKRLDQYKDGKLIGNGEFH